MTSDEPLKVVLSQIASAKQELTDYPPAEIDWPRRCKDTAKVLVPWLQKQSPELKVFVEEVVNSRQLVRKSWERIVQLSKGHLPGELIATMNRELDRESILLEYVGGNIVSKVIEKHLIESFPRNELESNGASDYPDLFLRSNDYESLKKYGKIKDGTGQYGPALKGPAKRPARVPDGLEVKTCKKRFAVDCHHAHAGLHLALIFDSKQGLIEVADIMVAFMRYEDYRITNPSTPTTTLKASFNGKNFVSLLPKSLQR